MRAFVLRALRRVYRALLPESAKNTLRLQLLFDERDKPPRTCERFDERSVVVLAPHMDDEVYGCGGASCLHARAGGRVTVVFTTDGAGRDATTAERTEESRRAATVLGTHELRFLGGPDGALRVEDALVQALADVLAERRPELVYTPALVDTHADHWVTSRILARALARLEAPVRDGITIRQYEVWTPLLANLLVDVEDVWAEKEAALECFESQGRALDLVGTSKGLARYRSIHRASGRGLFEAFHESDVRAFLRVLERHARGSGRDGSA